MNNTPIPAWLAAAVMAAGMTAYADDCTAPRAPTASRAASRTTPPADPNPHNENDHGETPAPG